MKNYLLLLALAASFTVTSCSKDDDDDEPAPVTNVTNNNTTIQNPLSGISQGSTDPAVIQFTKEILTGTEWKLNALVKGIDNTLNFKDLYKDLQPCQRDDVYSFTANGALSVSDNVNWCGSAMQDKTGTWSMTNSSALTITASGLINGIAGQSTIMQISENSLVLQQKVNGFSYVITFEKHIPPAPEFLMLVNKSWKVTSDQTYYWTSGNTLNAPVCVNDNILFFGGNGILNTSEGAVVCPGAQPTYSESYNYTHNYVYFSGRQFYIDDLTATKLVLVDNSNQGYIVRTITYTKQ